MHRARSFAPRNIIAGIDDVVAIEVAGERLIRAGTRHGELQITLIVQISTRRGWPGRKPYLGVHVIRPGGQRTEIIEECAARRHDGQERAIGLRVLVLDEARTSI